MEIRATTIIFAKRKARQKRDEEKELLMRFNFLQERLRHNFDESIKAEMDGVKNKLAKIIAVKTRGAIVRTKSRWYEFGEKNSKYFYNLEKRNHRKKHITCTSLKKQNDTTISCPKEILEEEANFFSQLYETKNFDPNQDQFKSFFVSEGIIPLESEKSDSCELLITVHYLQYCL